jgi:hypothetical protein
VRQIPSADFRACGLIGDWNQHDTVYASLVVVELNGKSQKKKKKTVHTFHISLQNPLLIAFVGWLHRSTQLRSEILCDGAAIE